MKRLLMFLIVLAIVAGAFGPAFAQRPDGDSPCTPIRLEQCVAVDTAAFVLPTPDNGSCGFKAIAGESPCAIHEPEIVRGLVRGTEHAPLTAVLAQPERPPKNA